MNKEDKAMKKNLSNIKALAILLTASAIVTACTNDELIEPASTEKTYTLTVNAVNGSDNGSTRALNLDGKTLNAAWATDETIYVKKDDAEVGTLNPETNGVSALLKGTLTGNFAVGQKLKLTYPRADIDYSGQVGTLSDIAAKYNYATATATITNVSGSTLVADNGAGGPVVFENQQAIVKFTLVDKAEGTPLAASQLVVEADGATYTVTPEAPVSELYVAIPGISGQNVTVTATVGGDTYTFEQPNVTFSNGQYYAITVKMTKIYNPYETPLTIEAMEAGCTIYFMPSEDWDYYVEYSTDGIVWNSWDECEREITLSNIGDKVSFRSNSRYEDSEFECEGRCYIYGNVMSLINSTDYATATELTKEYQFSCLFRENETIYSHPTKKIVLPATTLTEYCYERMFYGCTNLTTAPELPATTLATQCYNEMFYGCTNLTSAPELPATTLATQCYSKMFYGCNSLTTAPAALPATTLAEKCYEQMFYGCTSLTTAPELPATTLAEICYSSMFQGCTNLTTAPELPATTLARRCYEYMFYGCKNLNSVKCLATDRTAQNCTNYWLYGVSSTGTFTKAAGVEWTTGVHGIPVGWTVVEE